MKKNWFRVSAGSVLGALVLHGVPARAVESRRSVYVVSRKPPSVSVVDTATWKPVEQIKIDPQPTGAVLSPDNRYLYVLHNGTTAGSVKEPKAASALSIIEVDSRTVVKKLELGWHVAEILFSEDSRYLLLFGAGAWREKSELPARVTLVDWGNDHSEWSVDVGPPGTTIAINRDCTRIAALTVPPAVTSARVLASESALFKATTGPKRVNASLRLFRVGSPLAEASLELEHFPEQMVLSPDEKWVYLLDSGIPSKNMERFREGTLDVLDFASGEIAKSYNLGTRPHDLRADREAGDLTVLGLTSMSAAVSPGQESAAHFGALLRPVNSSGNAGGKLYRFQGAEMVESADAAGGAASVLRLANMPGHRVLLGDSQICVWPDGKDFTAGSTCTLLNPPRKQEAGKQAHPIDSFSGQLLPLPSKPLGGIPDEVLYLPGENRLAVKAQQQLGLVNLAENRLESVLTTGRGGVKFGKVFGAVAASAVLAGVIGAAIPSPVIMYPSPRAFLGGARYYGLTASDDGRFLYALNGFSDDVTILDAKTGVVIDKIGVGGGCTGISFSPNGRFLVAQSASQVTLIDPETNRKHSQHSVKTPGSAGRSSDQYDAVKKVHMLRSLQRIVALSSKALMAVDAETGMPIATVGEYGDPFLLLEPTKEIESREN